MSLSKGVVLDQPDICSRALRNLFSTMPGALRAPETQPRFVVVTSNGITAKEHAALPFALKPFYGAMLAAPHADKLAAERILAHLAHLPWSGHDVPDKDILPDGWETAPGMLKEGALKRFVILRPALLTDGEEKGVYRTSADAVLPGAYKISRKDVAHFVVQGIMTSWSKYEGKAVVIAY